MKKRLTVSAVIVAASLLFTGCASSSDTAISEDAPLVSSAEGLGEPKVNEGVFNVSSFEQVYQSTNGAISFKTLDALDWKVERVLKAPKGESLPKGDNFKATAANNFSYSDTVKLWVEELKEDGWKAENEVKAEPREDEELYTGTKEDYRAKPYSVDLSKGKTTIQIDMNEDIVMTINSQ